MIKLYTYERRHTRDGRTETFLRAFRSVSGVRISIRADKTRYAPGEAVHRVVELAVQGPGRVPVEITGEEWG